MVQYVIVQVEKVIGRKVSRGYLNVVASRVARIQAMIAKLMYSGFEKVAFLRLHTAQIRPFPTDLDVAVALLFGYDTIGHGRTVEWSTVTSIVDIVSQTFQIASFLEVHLGVWVHGQLFVFDAFVQRLRFFDSSRISYRHIALETGRKGYGSFQEEQRLDAWIMDQCLETGGVRPCDAIVVLMSIE